MTPTAASQRGVLVEQDELAGHGRNDATDRLGDDDVEHRLRTSHAKRARCLELALGYRLDTGAEDLAQVGARVDGKHDDGEDVLVDVDAQKR